MPLTDTEPWEDAIRTLRQKLPVGSKRKTKDWQRQGQAVRERSFFSATIEGVRFLSRMRDFLLDYLEREVEDTEGGLALKADGRARFVRDFARLAIAEGLGPVGIPADMVDPNDLTDIRSEARLKLIFDTQVRQAVGYGWYTQGMDPDILAAFPAARFVRRPGSVDKRPRHQRHQGDVRLKTDTAYWADYQNDSAIGGFQVPWPPYGFNSNMDQEDVSRQEAIDLGVLKEGQEVPGTAQSFNQGLRASVRGLDADLKKLLEKELNTKAEGGEIKPEPNFQPDLPGL